MEHGTGWMRIWITFADISFKIIYKSCTMDPPHNLSLLVKMAHMVVTHTPAWTKAAQFAGEAGTPPSASFFPWSTWARWPGCCLGRSRGPVQPRPPVDPSHFYGSSVCIHVKDKAANPDEKLIRIRTKRWWFVKGFVLRCQVSISLKFKRIYILLWRTVTKIICIFVYT